MTIGHPLPGRVTHATLALYPLPVRRIRDFVISFLQIPPRDGHPCLDGWFRSLRSIGGLHPLKTTSYSTHQAIRLSHQLARCVNTRWDRPFGLSAASTPRHFPRPVIYWTLH